MSDNPELDYKIGIIGPTRVGKTSLIAAILKDSQNLLAGELLSIQPHGNATRQRLAKHHKELEGSLRAGKFHPGNMPGNQEAFRFELRLDPGEGAPGIQLRLLDYPGGWLDENRRRPENQEEWEKCKHWMHNSSVLIIPVEAPMLMETVSSKTKHLLPSALTLPEVEQVAVDWAKERSKRHELSSEPALLLFCPVKCESYFNDNDGIRDMAEELFKAICHHYQSVLKTVRTTAPFVKMLYLPVDTIGCVELIKSDWVPDTAEPSGFRFSAHYRVRPPGHQSIKGANDVLIALCKHLVEAKKCAEALIADKKLNDAEAAKHFAEKDEGFLRNIWLWASRERRRRERRTETLIFEAKNQKKIVETLEQIISRLAERNLGPRTRSIF